jgi:two-component system, cell cycle sensor histidine kinase and response regulator CckA
MLAFSRTPQSSPAVLDLNERLKDISKLLRPLLGDDVEILIVPRSPSAVVEADPGQLDQIVVNLAVNARDAMPRGGKFILETGAVNFDEAFAEQHQAMAAGKYVCSRSAIPAPAWTRLPCRASSSPSSPQRGRQRNWFGLATVYGIVKQSGGHILVYSEPGQGTTFKIYLPSAEHKIGSDPSRKPETVSPKRQGNTILLVEDDEIMRSLDSTTSQEHGYTVVEANDGKSALELVESNRVRSICC